MYYKLDGNSLVKAPNIIEKDGTTYINNVQVLKEEGYKPLVLDEATQVVLDETVQDRMIAQGSTYTQDENYIYEHKIWKSLEEIQKEQDAYENTRQFTVEEVIKTVFQKSINTYDIEDSKSLRMVEYYPLYQDLIDTEVDAGFKLQHNGILYKALKKQTISSAYVPGVGTESLYVVVVEDHKGTLDDPIPYAGNMILEKDKYYIQDNVIYHCTRDSGNPLYNDLKDLINLYVEKV